MFDNNKNSTKRQKKLTVLLLVVYLVVLSWIVLFKMKFDISLLKNMNFRSVNLLPFAGSLVVNGKVAISEIILNIVAFIPFGVYLSMLNVNWGFLKKILPIFSVSLLYEITQYIFAIGASDITDLIGNTLGGAIGIGIFFLLQRLLGKKTIKFLNILATIGTIAVVFFLALLTILLTIANM